MHAAALVRPKAALKCAGADTLILHYTYSHVHSVHIMLPMAVKLYVGKMDFRARGSGHSRLGLHGGRLDHVLWDA